MSRTCRIYRKLRRLVHRAPWPQSSSVRRPVVALVGCGVLFVGVALIVLPGPALLVIPMGLIILAMEFVCVRRWLRTVRRLGQRNLSSSLVSSED